MLPSDVPDQISLQMRINVSGSLHEYAKDFAAAGPGAISIDPACYDLKQGSYGKGDYIPIVRLDHGGISFEVAHWGVGGPGQAVEYFRECSGQSLGYPALIPASFVEIMGRGDAVRLTDYDGKNLYLAAMYFQSSRGAPISVVPLIRGAGPDIAPYSDLQPLLIPIQALPRSGIRAFIDPQDGAPHLRRASLAGTIKIENVSAAILIGMP
jgi:hypothetical protein